MWTIQERNPRPGPETTPKNTVRLRYWALAWVTTLAPAAFGPIIGPNINALPTVLAGTIADYWKYQ